MGGLVVEAVDELVFGGMDELAELWMLSVEVVDLGPVIDTVLP